MQRIAVILAALWWGGMTALSFVAVPTLFASLGGPAVAGPVAARLFSIQCWAVLLIGAALMLILRRRRTALVVAGQASDGLALDAMKRTLASMALVLCAMLLAMFQEFGVAHQIVTARSTGGSLRLWHTLGTVLVVAQWVCAGAVLWRLSGTRGVAGRP